MSKFKENVIEEDFDDDLTNEIQLVSFKLIDEEFGIPIENIQEIIRMKEITKLPGTLSFIEGVIDLRGKILPVINLRKKLNLEIEKFNPATRIIVIETDDIETGLIVDNVSEVLRIPKDNVKKPPSLLGKDAEYITGMVRFDSRLIILLDVKNIISKDDVIHLAEITKKINNQETTGESENHNNLNNIPLNQNLTENSIETNLCKGVNPDGTKCTRLPMKGSEYCEIHQPE